MSPIDPVLVKVYRIVMKVSQRIWEGKDAFAMLTCLNTDDIMCPCVSCMPMYSGFCLVLLYKELNPGPQGLIHDRQVPSQESYPWICCSF